MGQSKPLRAAALIVEDDAAQRDMMRLLLEESDYEVISCESGEMAELILRKNGSSLSLLITDVQLAGNMNGVEVAYVAKEYNPKLDVVVTSGRPLSQPLPDEVKFWAKPWSPLDMLREAETAKLMGEAAATPKFSQTMATYALPQNSCFEPEDIERLAMAHVETLRALGLKDRSDPITQLVAEKIIEIAQTGVRDPAEISKLAVGHLGSPYPRP